MDEPETIPASRRKKLVFAMIASAVALTGLGLAAWHSPLALNRPFGMQEQRRFFLGCLLAIGGSIALLIGLWRLLLRRELRITSESVQILDPRRGLIGNLPFSNLERCELVGEDSIPVIRIWMRDFRQPETHWPGGWLARWWTRRESGCDVTLGPSWMIPVAELFRRINAAYEAWRRAGVAS